MMMSVVFLFFLPGSISNATVLTTKRTMELSNDKVSAWETIIYPGTKQSLKMHRHEHDRVVIALSDGLLKITNDKGNVHYLKLQKNKAYYLTKDLPDELHTDENISSQPIKVIVVELIN
jgi:hypothetical protein